MDRELNVWWTLLPDAFLGRDFNWSDNSSAMAIITYTKNDNTLVTQK